MVDWNAWNSWYRSLDKLNALEYLGYGGIYGNTLDYGTFGAEYHRLSIIDRDFMINILLIVQVFGQAVSILLHIEDSSEF